MDLVQAQPKLFDTEHARGRKLQTEKNHIWSLRSRPDSDGHIYDTVTKWYMCLHISVIMWLTSKMYQ